MNDFLRLPAASGRSRSRSSAGSGKTVAESRRVFSRWLYRARDEIPESVDLVTRLDGTQRINQRYDEHCECG